MEGMDNVHILSSFFHQPYTGFSHTRHCGEIPTIIAAFFVHHMISTEYCAWHSFSSTADVFVFSRIVEINVFWCSGIKYHCRSSVADLLSYSNMSK